jgi:hypothetical protein
VGYQTVPVPSSRVVIIEGIYALSERLRPLLDLRVSIAGGVHFDLIKRVLRDITRSGQGPEEIIQQVRTAGVCCQQSWVTCSAPCVLGVNVVLHWLLASCCLSGAAAAAAAAAATILTPETAGVAAAAAAGAAAAADGAGDRDCIPHVQGLH